MVPPADAVPAVMIGKRVPPSGTVQGPSLVPPSALADDPVGQDAAPGAPPPGEVINLDDEAEDKPVGEASASGAPTAEAATVKMAAVAKVVAPAPAAVREVAAAATMARAPAAVTEAAAAETVARAPAESTGTAASETVARALAAATEAATAETVAPAAAAMTGTAASGSVALAPAATTGTVASGSTEKACCALIPLACGPNTWGGPTLRWMSLEDLQRHRFVLDVSGSGKDGSRGKSEFLLRERGVWQRFAVETWRTWELTGKLATAEQNFTDLRAREQEAREIARWAEDKFRAVVEKARLDAEEFQAAADKARHDAEELARLRKEHEVLQKTVERIRHERHAARQERDLEAGRKIEAENMVADLGAEVSRLHAQMQGLQTAVSQGLDRERLLKAQSEGLEADLARLRDAANAEHVEHANLRMPSASSARTLAWSKWKGRARWRLVSSGRTGGPVRSLGRRSMSA
ncbi:uncharacterized protein LOC105915129 [Setaria italica]|uniref:uncharacterized protein LOC105915129 n=1 Tax=Setaria italica TaxID=4555 RepID=UPI000646E5A6|nr:uncharacterized protein LOC105915129 [Setaria italica]